MSNLEYATTKHMAWFGVVGSGADVIAGHFEVRNTCIRRLRPDSFFMCPDFFWDFGAL